LNPRRSDNRERREERQPRFFSFSKRKTESDARSAGMSVEHTVRVLLSVGRRDGFRPPALQAQDTRRGQMRARPHAGRYFADRGPLPLAWTENRMACTQVQHAGRT
jgi:hypothetical protein